MTSDVALHLERATPVGRYPAVVIGPVFLAIDRILFMSASNGKRHQDRKLIQVQKIPQIAEDIYFFPAGEENGQRPRPLPATTFLWIRPNGNSYDHGKENGSIRRRRLTSSVAIATGCRAFEKNVQNAEIKKAVRKRAQEKATKNVWGED